MIRANAYRYPVSAMCRVLQVNRSTYYYEARQKRDESALVSDITDIFKASRNNYGARKIKKNWRKRGAGIQTQDREDHEAEGSGIGLHNRTVQTTKRS